MNNFLKYLLKHSTVVAVVSVLLLLLCAAALVLNPRILLAFLRYSAAALSVAVAIWIVVSLIETKILFRGEKECRK